MHNLSVETDTLSCSIYKPIGIHALCERIHPPIVGEGVDIILIIIVQRRFSALQHGLDGFPECHSSIPHDLVCPQH